MAKTPRRKVRVASSKKRTKPSTASSSKRSARGKVSRTTKKTGGAFKRGAAGFETARKKRERQEEDYQRMRDTPFDFRIKPGEEAEVILLDDADPFFVSLHKVKNSRGYFDDVVCIADTGEACPVCEDQGKEGAFTLVMTALDRRSFKTRDGKTVKVSKKLLKVKGRNLPKFQRQYEKLKGNFRGIKLLCRRDGDKEAAIGEDLQFEGRIKESALRKFRDLATPAPYEEIFEIPSAAELRKRHGLGKTNVAGSEEFDEDGDEDYDMDSVGWGDDE